MHLITLIILIMSSVTCTVYLTAKADQRCRCRTIKRNVLKIGCTVKPRDHIEVNGLRWQIIYFVATVHLNTKFKAEHL